ncbi:Crp/Fnr family transcriptional regulator [Geminicoccus roseus]|uniref:Crp/Fnr family transcriptional regulator n=1 Tax=Geminicoccus roseus TaxID=404900 RepID=UPI00048007B9|nr:Crp/Fnr family transcriptional regulator [Geminicoccus roseus]
MHFPNLDPSLIRDLSIFRSVGANDLEAVLAVATVRQLPKGVAAFEQGAAATEFFVLLHGRLRVMHTTSDGQQMIVRHVNPGEIFGLAKVMQRTSYPGTASAIVDSVALAWPTCQWEKFLAQSPVLAANALSLIGQRLQEADARLRELATEEVERRVAHALLRLAKQAGTRTEEGVLINFPLTRQDIAEMTGTTLHTVSRVMSRWEARGLVASGRKRVVLRDPHQLLMLAEQLPE